MFLKIVLSAVSAKMAGRSLLCISLCYFAGFLLTVSAQAQGADNQSIVREDNGRLGLSLKLPLYVWQVSGVAPKAVIVTIHGVTLHGAVFDTIARELAKDGYLVVSPDLRGFGRWYLGEDKFLSDGSVSFYKSRADLIRLLATLRANYNGLPIFCLGESLGANLALWLASVCPTYVDGVIVSSPCVKRKLDLCPPVVVDTVRAITDHNRQLSAQPYAKRYLSEDPRITESYLADPLIRKTMSIYESFQSLHATRSTLWYVEQIPANVPLLVLEGTKDKMFDSKEVEPLVRKIPVNDKSVVWLKGKGHIHLETPYVSREVVKTISTWLGEHGGRSQSSDQEAAFLSSDGSSSSKQEN